MTGRKQPTPALLSSPDVEAFRRTVYRHFHEYGRTLPWRETTDPYAIYVSEIMLQQTQVARAVDYYTAFLTTFPTVFALDNAPLTDVLDRWRGLGYNRRALQMKTAARLVVAEHGGVFPTTIEGLTALPGIGHATAAAICAYAYDLPVVFIETNIRTVFIHHFFPRMAKVPDRDILPLVEETLDREHPRRWYSALMDYGVTLKARHGNPGRRSARHTRQTRFEGSDRQIRGGILRVLANGARKTVTEIARDLDADTDRVKRLVGIMEREGFIDVVGDSAAVKRR